MLLVQDIDAYFAREVLPYAPDAWIDKKKTKVGVVFPPMEEQKEILNYLDAKCTAIDTLIAKKAVPQRTGKLQEITDL